MNLAGTVAAALARRRLRAMRRHAMAPAPAQAALLERLLANLAPTQFGRAHSLARVRTLRDLAAAVPLCDYETMRPWWERARAGETDVTWPGRIGHWALSSGTTSGEKYLPVSDATIRSNQGGGFDAIAPHLAGPGGADLLGGKLLFLGGCTALRREAGAWIGDNTGIMARNVPSLMRRWHAPAPDVRAIPDWEQKVRRAAATTLDDDLRMIAGVPSWIVLWAEAVLAAAACAGRPAGTLRDVWPSLALFVHGGVSFAPYRERVADLFGPGVRYLDTYSASEGGMLAVQDDPAIDGMLPLFDRGAVFEFVPLDELGCAAPRRFAADAIETGVDYAVALTTDAGIVSYLLGDAVRFVSRQPLRLVFAGRLAHTLNAFGEHVSGGELDRAVAAAASATDSTVHEYAVHVEFPTTGQPKGRHVFLVEFAHEVADPGRFANAVDAALRSGNEDYTVHRVHGLQAPIAIALEPGTYLQWMRNHGKVGGQHKVPRIVDDAMAAELVGLSAAAGHTEPSTATHREAMKPA